MNVSCPSCSTLYTIPDDKVAGRRARMQCKKCGAAIAVDGTALGRAASSSSDEAYVVEWNVAQPSGRRDVLTTAELLDRYQRDEVEPGALVWRAGMENWLPPYDVPELADAFASRGLRMPGAGLESTFDDPDEATRVGSSPAAVKALDAAVMRAEAERAAWQEHHHDEPVTFDDETRNLGSAEALALKRKAMRTMEDIGDLGAKSDGLIDEVTRAIDSIPRPLPPMPGPPPKRLSSSPPEEATRIYDAGGRAAPSDADADEATRVFQPSAPVDAEDEATRVFDAARGGASDTDESTRVYVAATNPAASAVAHPRPVPAPQAPPAPRPPPSRPHAPPSRPQAPSAAARPLPPGPAPKPPAVAAVEHQPAHPFARATGPEAGHAPSLLAAVQQSTVVQAPPPSAPRVAAPLGAPRHEEISGIGEPTRLSQRVGAGMTERRAAFAPQTRINSLFVGLFALLAAASIVYIAKPEWLGLGAPPPAPEVEASGPPFDPDAAGLALEEAATTASRCKLDGGPTGPGRVHVKYLTNGRAASASISDPYAGTDVGECLVNVFQNTKVPPFGGKPVIVGKNFAIQ